MDLTAPTDAHRGGRGALVLASVLVCGLLLLEDPAVLAVRARLADGGALVGVDLPLALAMVAYNVAASRATVRAAGAPAILDALDRVHAERAARVAATRSRLGRALRRGLARVNPFGLVRWVGERLARAEVVPGQGGRGGRVRGRLRRLAVELGAVNVLGVPGAGLALATTARRVSWWTSLRHGVLFVGSWFGAVHVAEGLWRVTGGLPLVGGPLGAAGTAVGEVAGHLTDPTGVLGACTVAFALAAVARDVRAVERELQRGAAG